jgi:hypothetical protein
MDAIFTRLITAGRNHPTVAMPAHQQGLALQRRIVDALDAYEKSIQIEMRYISLRTHFFSYALPNILKLLALL